CALPIWRPPVRGIPLLPGVPVGGDDSAALQQVTLDRVGDALGLRLGGDAREQRIEGRGGHVPEHALLAPVIVVENARVLVPEVIADRASTCIGILAVLVRARLVAAGLAAPRDRPFQP